MVEVELPTPQIKIKAIDPLIEQQGLAAGLHPIVARIVAARPIPDGLPLMDALSPKLKHLFLPFTMVDMQKAAFRVAQAIMQGECIGIETDHDCDGQTSHAVIYHNLLTHFHHPKEKIRSYIGHRLKEGYGLSESVALRILQDSPQPSLVITADNGSNDEPRIKKLKQAGIDVIVTDHHEIPKEGYPKSAFACLNPTRADCEYGDPYIAGCMVAWLLMAATRQQLIENNYLPHTAKSLMDSLDFVAVGTIADCVSMARSVNNRIVVSYGLRLIEAGTRPCWRVVKKDARGPLSSEDLGFKIGPLLNSDGRLATALGSVSFLLAETDAEAEVWIGSLHQQNSERKIIQQEIIRQGLLKAKQQAEHRLSICIYLKEGHPGVHGIAASRIKDIFGRPTVFLAPKLNHADLMTGSVRGIEGFHVREALQTVANWNPELLIAFGGHKGAGGVTLRTDNVELFSQAFESATEQQLADQSLGPVVWTDGALSVKHLNLELLDTLSLLEPFGREFEPPIFELQAQVKEIRMIGDGTHARILLESEGKSIAGVWFKIRQTPTGYIPIKIEENVKVAFTLKANYFRNDRTLDIHIHQVEKL
jgi:single-stranded-DNA-specific exonuclease